MWKNRSFLFFFSHFQPFSSVLWLISLISFGKNEKESTKLEHSISRQLNCSFLFCFSFFFFIRCIEYYFFLIHLFHRCIGCFIFHIFFVCAILHRVQNKPLPLTVYGPRDISIKEENVI